jgi:hypothetical protein
VSLIPSSDYFFISLRAQRKWVAYHQVARQLVIEDREVYHPRVRPLQTDENKTHQGHQNGRPAVPESHRQDLDPEGSGKIEV